MAKDRSLFLVKDNLLGESAVMAVDEREVVSMILRRVGGAAGDLKEINVRFVCREDEILSSARGK